MHYQKITKYDTANGPGIRTVLWTSGCPHHCKGCHNPDTWNPNQGKVFTIDSMNEILESLSPSYIRGLTLSGGDPLAPYNIDVVSYIVQKVKDTYPNKDIWLWTGYLWEDILDIPLLEYINVLVDGPFILEKRDITHPYHGSPNQRVIDVQKSRETDQIVLYTS